MAAEPFPGYLGLHVLEAQVSLLVSAPLSAPYASAGTVCSSAALSYIATCIGDVPRTATNLPARPPMSLHTTPSAVPTTTATMP